MVWLWMAADIACSGDVFEAIAICRFDDRIVVDGRIESNTIQYNTISFFRLLKKATIDGSLASSRVLNATNEFLSDAQNSCSQSRRQIMGISGIVRPSVRVRDVERVNVWSCGRIQNRRSLEYSYVCIPIGVATESVSLSRVVVIIIIFSYFLFGISNRSARSCTAFQFCVESPNPKQIIFPFRFAKEVHVIRKPSKQKKIPGSDNRDTIAITTTPKRPSSPMIQNGR